MSAPGTVRPQWDTVSLAPAGGSLGRGCLLQGISGFCALWGLEWGFFALSLTQGQGLCI